jgi:hypothetical protein
MSDEPIVVLKGRISDYDVTRKKADFFFSPKEQQATGLIAVAATLMGQGAPAMGMVVSASNKDEAADRVEFTLDRQPFGEHVKGWLWRSPFAEGDEVEVVAARRGGYYEALAVARPADRMIALYPHLSRGRKAHVWNAAKWWFLGTTMLVSFVLLLGILIGSSQGHRKLIFSSEFAVAVVVPVVLFSYAFFLLPAIHTTWRWMHFVRVAEDVFKTLGWKDVENVDLVKSSKAQRKGNEPPEYRYFYFRY